MKSLHSTTGACLLLLWATLAGRADSLDVATLSIKKSGQFTFAGVGFTAGHFNPQWIATDQGRLRAEPGFPKEQDNVWETQGQLRPADGGDPLLLAETVQRLDAQGVRVTCRFASAGGEIPTQETYLRIDVPVALAAGKALVIDGNSHPLPVDFKQANLLEERELKPRKLAIPAEGGTLLVEGFCDLQVQDRRQWKTDAFAIRLRFGSSKPLGDARGEFTIRRLPARVDPLPLRDAANRSFRDEIAGDGLGGWTDEGPGNDLAALPTGPLQAAGIAFDILDPAANGNRGALVLSPGEKGQATAMLPLSNPSPWRNLYLLHAASRLPKPGEPVGTLKITYTDGSEQTRPVRAGQDVGNWWTPTPLPNGAIGWIGENTSSVVGLYVSRFTLESKPVARVDFACAGKSLWMIAAVSASPDDLIPSTVRTPLVVKAGESWAPYEHSIDIEPGSVFDFSFLADAPAGRHGPLKTTAEGHLEFSGQPGGRARFWGVNLVTSAIFLEKPEADLVAKRLALSGYNTVRFFGIDHALRRPGGKSHEFDPQQLDRLDYLFAALKSRGIYLNINLFELRGFSAGELTAFQLDPALDRGETRPRFKVLLPISEEAFAAWKQFAANLLTHRNPYTQLTWAEDPALIGICPVNEDTLLAGSVEKFPEIQKRYDAAFSQWLAADPATRRGNREALYNRFLGELQQRSNRRMMEFLRSLKVNALITGTNYKETQAQVLLESDYDYVDNHQYWDHPLFPGKRWKLPFLLTQGSATHFLARVPIAHAPLRYFGKPFAVTEFNFVRPNRFRAEGGVLMPAYASLQDWDALYNYKYANTRVIASEGGVDQTGIFSIASDPVNLLADRVSALIFRRGDIAPARQTIAFAVEPDIAFSGHERGFPPQFSQLGLVTRIGSLPGDPAALIQSGQVTAVVTDPTSANAAAKVYRTGDDLSRRLEQDGVLPPGSIRATAQQFTSDTGQIRLDTSVGTLAVTSPRSELFVLPPNQTLQGQRVSVQNGGTFGTVSVVSVEARPLAESRRLLLVHLTNALPAAASFDDQDERLLTARGQAPFLVEKGSATVTLRLDPQATYQAWAVAPTGKRLRTIPMRAQTGGVYLLELSTVAHPGTCFAYEILRN